MVSAANSLPTVVAQVNAFLASAREKAKGGITWVEFGQLLVELLHIVVTGLEAVQTMTGAEKKQIAMEAVAALFDSFADLCVPMAVWPVWLVIRPGIRVLVLSLASGGIEALLKVVRLSAP